MISNRWKIIAAALPIIGTCALAQPQPGGLGGFFSAWYGVPTIPKSGLYAEYLFNNNLLDTSGNGYDLIARGLTTTNGFITFNTAIGATGAWTDQNTNFLSGVNQFTISFWAKAADRNANYPFTLQITNIPTASNRGVDIQWRPDIASNRLDMLIFNAAGSASWAFRHTNFNVWAVITNWTHFVFQWDYPSSNTTYVYVNNTLNPRYEVAQSGSAPTNIPSGRRLWIGNNESGLSGRLWRGSQGHWRVYTRVLTAGEIASLYNEGPPE